MTREKILIVDDDREIWSAYRSVLAPEPVPKTDFDMLTELVIEEADHKKDEFSGYDVSFIPQGKEAYEHVLEQKELCQNYAVAFIDIRMPPGWNGIKTAQHIRAIDPDIEIVMVTAYTDISRSQIVNEVGTPEKLLYLRKPFDSEELSQIALQLTTKWTLYQQEREQRINIEKLLKKNQQINTYLDGIINSMPSMLIGVSGEGWITHWNDRIAQFTGLSQKETLNESIEKILPELEGINSLVYRSAIRSTIKTKEKFKFKYKDKSILCDIVVYPISVQEENITIKYSAVIRIDDITERVKLEEVVLQSDKMLTVGGLAAGMAHEINTPLGSIMQNAQVITNRIATDNNKNSAQAKECGTTIEHINDYLKQRGIIQLLEGIRECGTRTSKLVKSMLSFSHKSSSMTKERLSDVIDEAITLSMNDYDMKKHYHFRDFDIQTEYDSQLEPVACEKTKIEQVIMNLLKNSAQSMMDMPPDHKPQINIKTSQRQDYACIELADNGPGISPENQKRIFDPFFTTKEVGVGTGLGLSLSYFIITKNHKGIIQVESEVGKGCRFIIQLPFHQDIK